MAVVPNFKLQHGAPWHCQCTQEIFVRCNSPDLPYFESSDPETAHWMKFPGLLGSEYRKEAISSSIKAFTVYSYTSVAATATALITFVAITMKCLKRCVYPVLLWICEDLWVLIGCFHFLCASHSNLNLTYNHYDVRRVLFLCTVLALNLVHGSTSLNWLMRHMLELADASHA